MSVTPVRLHRAVNASHLQTAMSELKTSMEMWSGADSDVVCRLALRTFTLDLLTLAPRMFALTIATHVSLT